MESVPSGKNCCGQLSRQQQGQQYEQRARRWLEQAGLRFIAANVRFRSGELDLIMRDRETIVFVEVRYRRNDRFGGAAASVTERKQQRLKQAAACWLAGEGARFHSAPCRFDVIAITGSQIQWLRSAFYADL
ncbi:YraN family protein [Erwinia sp. OLTSP20]|uniref:YraN family protein n=1 Tax=unclassified Erwinia TaxID=2622719 RepID=UPI000C181BEE|nr:MULTISPECIES: YraN family protein [unclassified Erwinia]PIJ52029.1 YraN family protein [Erwinia sp. OAMSP11]PIJ75192.1 YraN family protein [Erwinia sp. OLSSP12]PIJ84399.1 YraN family protein [Erwinia sp. OLCASP19]PIJ87013.1 YraN family protein [Erwinia sp. OLMTSP26]PIJ88576.1 YraN family protein [Erwinia sp. OLMDSP33]